MLEMPGRQNKIQKEIQIYRIELGGQFSDYIKQLFPELTILLCRQDMQ